MIRNWYLYLLCLGLFPTPATARSPIPVKAYAKKVHSSYLVSREERLQRSIESAFLRLPAATREKVWKALFTISADTAPDDQCSKVILSWNALSPALERKISRLLSWYSYRVANAAWTCSGFQSMAWRIARQKKPSAFIAKYTLKHWKKETEKRISPVNRAKLKLLMEVLFHHRKYVPDWGLLMWQSLASGSPLYPRLLVLKKWRSLRRKELQQFLKAHSRLPLPKRKVALRYLVGVRNHYVLPPLRHSLRAFPKHSLLRDILFNRIRFSKDLPSFSANLYWDMVPDDHRAILRALVLRWNKRRSSYLRMEMQRFFNKPAKQVALVTLMLSSSSMRGPAYKALLTLNPGIPFGLKTLMGLWIFLVFLWGVRKIFFAPSTPSKN